MRILYINYSKHGSGSLVHTTMFFNALKAIHNDVFAYTPLSGESQSTGEEGKGRSGGRSGQLREVRFLAAAFFRRAFEEALQLYRLKPDLVILRRDRYLSAIILCRLFKIPIILEVNGPFLEERFMPERFRLRGFKFWEFLEKKILDLANHITVVSNPLKKYYVDAGISQEKITTVPNGADIKLFSPDVDDKKTRDAFDTTGKIVIGFMGTFAAWHGLDFLAETMKELVKGDQNKENQIILLLIGTSKYNFDMPDLSGVEIKITGYIPFYGIPSILSGVDIFVAPYPKIEPFYFSPLKILEAMAAGKPVLSSAQGQIIELITDNVNGMLYPPEDKEVFLKKLRVLISEKNFRNQLGRKARETIIKNYTWDDNARRVLNICKHFMKKK